MSLPRSLFPLCSSSCSALKFASQSSRCCIAASRNFTCALRRTSSGQRKIVTATAYRPSSLETPLAPPRNSKVPDTSIAGPAIPQFNDIRNPSKTREQKTEISLTEAEAQKSKPVEAPPTEQTLASSTKPKRPRLRPRKAAMNLTPSAVEHLKGLLELPEPKLIRVGVKNRGCSGLAYHLEYVDKPGTFDETVEQDGVKVLIDSKALFSIIGSEMDWIEDKLSQRFVFKNPNIKEECGCGESFMV